MRTRTTSEADQALVCVQNVPTVAPPRGDFGRPAFVASAVCALAPGCWWAKCHDADTSLVVIVTSTHVPSLAPLWVLLRQSMSDESNLFMNQTVVVL